MPSVPVTIVGVLTYSGDADRPPGSPPLGIWGGAPLPVPTPPIYYPPAQPPLGIWGGGNVPYPTPPIYLPPAGGGPPPLGIWGGGNVPYPTPPIYYPPLGTWGGGNVPYPTPPIYFPPPSPPEKPPEPPASGGGGQWHYVPGLGWVFYAEGGKWVFVGGDKPQPPSVPEGPPQVNPLPKK